MPTATAGIVASSRVGQETQLRVPGGANNVMTTPDHAAFQINDVDCEWFGSLDDPTTADQAIIGQWSSVSAQRGWGLRIVNVAGVIQLRLWTSTTGANSASNPDGIAVLSIAANQYFGVRASRRQSDGLVHFYFSSVDPPSWTLLGQSTISAGSVLWNSTATMMVGGFGATAGSSSHAIGYFRHGVVRNGFVGGTVIADPDVRAVSDAATGFTDSTGKVWTVGGIADLVTRSVP